jgi:DNA polymerase-3 subunit gamma/tau
MSYLVLARKWRPQTFEEVVGQSHVTQTLQNAISAGRVAHGYLFTGPRGVGKTSTARILAKALNCEKGPTPHPCLVCPACVEIAGPGSVDVIEIDGASNNSVDDIRNLRERVMYSGARDRHKVYIIDEVHMLSGAAFNALLKTLEEPPPHVIFIFATTEVQKIPPTILSRAQRFDFRRVGSAELSAQLRKIMTAEGLEASDEALQMVSRAGGGSVRDSQTLLDQVISFALGSDEKRALRAEDVLAVLGGVPEGQALNALRQALTGESQEALLWLQAQYQRGADLRQVLDAFQQLLRGLLLAKSGAGDDTDLLPETRATLKEMSHGLGLSRLFTAIKACADAENQLRYSSHTRLVMELLILQLAPAAPGASLGELVDELAALERRLENSAKQAPVAVAVAAVAVAVAQAPSASPSAPLPAAAGGSGQALPPQVEVAPQSAAPSILPSQAGEPALSIEAIEEAPVAAAWTVERFRADWHALMDRVRPGSLNLATSAQDAELVSFAQGVLTVRVPNAYQRRTLDDAAERARLEQALTDHSGQAVKVQVAFAEPVKKRAADGKPNPEEVAKLLSERPEIRRVQELFGGEIVEIRND